jgi:acetyltransferase-like isoleucine patch superfamily enzyme
MFDLVSKIIDKIYTIVLRRKFKFCGKNVKIRFPITITNPKKISIGDNVFIGEHVWLNAGQNPTFSNNHNGNDDLNLIIKSGCYISRFSHINAFHHVCVMEDVLIGENVYLGDTDHSNKLKDIPIIKQIVEVKEKVIIGTGSHVCKNAIIASGVSIGKNSIVGPNAFLTKNLPDYATAIGNPAFIIENNEN